MTLSAGTRLGPYESLSPLGAGGTGDGSMKRIVALVAFHLGLLVGVGYAVVVAGLTGTLLAQTSGQVPGSTPVPTGKQITRQPATKQIGREAVAQPDDNAAYDTVDSKIEAFEKIHGERVYLEGRPTDAVLLPDGTIAYLLEWPPAEMLHNSNGSWVLIAHPVRGAVSTPIDPVTGAHIAIGSTPDGTYYGFAWFMETVPDVVIAEGRIGSASLYETHPPDIEKWYAERARFSNSVGAAVQKWWADQEEWSENLRAGDLVPHSGLISDCRETDGATVVTVKGDGTFQFLYRDRDRVTYEGVQASNPCDFVGERVVVWTLPCGDDGPCIRKVEAIDGPAETPKASKVEAVAENPVPHSGLIDDCRERGGRTVVTVKGNGTFQFLYRSRDRVVYEGVQAGSPCDLIGRKMVVWTVACGEDSPCISKVEAVTGQ